MRCSPSRRTRPGSWVSSSGPGGSTRYPWSIRDGGRRSLSRSARDRVHRQLPPSPERRGGRVPVQRRPAAASARICSPTSGVRGRQPPRTRTIAAHGRWNAATSRWSAGSLGRAVHRARAGLRRSAAARRGCQGQGRRVVDGRNAGGHDHRRGRGPRASPGRARPDRGHAGGARGRARSPADRCDPIGSASPMRATSTLPPRHAPERVAERFHEILESVLTGPPRSLTADGARGGKTGRRGLLLRDEDRGRRNAAARSRRLGRACWSSSHGDDALLIFRRAACGALPAGPGRRMGAASPGGQRRGDRAPRAIARARGALLRATELPVLVAPLLQRPGCPPGRRLPAHLLR